MPDRSAVAYVYDGSFEGFLSLVFESWRKKEMPSVIFPQGGEQLVLFPVVFVETDIERSERVRKGIVRAAGAEALGNIECCFLSNAAEKELLLLDYIRLCIANGPKTLSMLADNTVCAVMKAARACLREAHHYKGFVRFSVRGEVMACVIEPKHAVLPLIADHFCGRYSWENFIIYDKTHGLALLYSKGCRALVAAQGFEPPPADAGEREARRLWKLFYDTVAIEERDNPRCRMSLMPKRFWSLLTEMQDETEKPALPQLGRLPAQAVAGVDEQELDP